MDERCQRCHHILFYHFYTHFRTSTQTKVPTVNTNACDAFVYINKRNTTSYIQYGPLYLRAPAAASWMDLWLSSNRGPSLLTTSWLRSTGMAPASNTKLARLLQAHSLSAGVGLQSWRKRTIIQSLYRVVQSTGNWRFSLSTLLYSNSCILQSHWQDLLDWQIHLHWAILLPFNWTRSFQNNMSWQMYI